MNRRRIGLIGIIAMAFMSGCDRNGEMVDQPEPASTVKEITLLSWSEYFDPEVIEGFTEESGIAVNYVTYDDPDELEAMLLSRPGEFDVVVADDVSISRLAELRVLKSLDKSAISHLRNVSVEYLGKGFDPENLLSVPYLWGTTLIAYRSDKIEISDESWDVLWDARFKGKVMLLGDRTEGLGIGLMSKGFPINSADPVEIGVAAEQLIAGIRNVGMRMGSDSEVREALDTGDVWLAACYSGDAAMVAAENENISFFIPRNGAPLWMDSFVVAGASGKSAEAHRFINYMLRAEAAGANANFTWYGSTNSAAGTHIAAELLADVAVNPPEEVRAKCQFFDKPNSVREKLLNAAWARVQSVLYERGVMVLNAGVDQED